MLVLFECRSVNHGGINMCAGTPWGKTRYMIAKRLLDITISLFAIVLLSPIVLGCIVVLFIFEGCPILYISKRHISVDKSISVIKFRTMHKDAHSPKYRLEQRFMHDGFLDIPINCEVYTRFGRILERFQIVEVWQFFNVLFNGMSVIGNRPLPRKNVELLKKFENWDQRFNSPAGISGISQIVGKLSLTAEERLNLEVQYSKVYLKGNIFFCDLHIIYHTIKVVLFGKWLPKEEAKKLLSRYSCYT